MTGYNFNFCPDESNTLISEYERVEIDERWEAFAGVRELDQGERNALAALIQALGKEDRDEDAQDVMLEMHDCCYDGDPDIGGWRGLLAEWAAEQEIA